LINSFIALCCHADDLQQHIESGSFRQNWIRNTGKTIWLESNFCAGKYH